MNNNHEQVAITAASHNLGDKLDADRIQDAAQADEIEHKQTWKEAFAIHKKAIFWSMALSGALIMEGYDVVVIGSFYGQRELSQEKRSLKCSDFPSKIRRGRSRFDQRICYSR